MPASPTRSRAVPADSMPATERMLSWPPAKASPLTHASIVNVAGIWPKPGTAARPPRPSRLTAWSGPGVRHTWLPPTAPPCPVARRPEMEPLGGVQPVSQTRADSPSGFVSDSSEPRKDATQYEYAEPGATSKSS